MFIDSVYNWFSKYSVEFSSLGMRTAPGGTSLGVGMGCRMVMVDGY